MKKTFSLLAAIALAFNVYAQDSLAVKYASTITVEDLEKYLTVLASDDFEGRETGYQGQKMAAEYLANHFESIGIPPYIDKTYYQDFGLSVVKVEKAELTIGEKKYAFTEDFYFFPDFGKASSADIKINELVFLGYGIESENYNDYEDIDDLSGKTVFIIGGEPKNKKGEYYVSKSTEKSEWSSVKKKVAHAKEKGATTVIVYDEDVVTKLSGFKHYLLKETATLKEVEEENKKINTLYVDKSLADAIIESSSSKKNLEKLISKINKKGKPRSEQFEFKASYVRKMSLKRQSGENVLGYIEGTDLKDELLIITAHYDHIGMHDGEVFNGADDDGSGTSAIMEIAQAFMEAKAEGNGPRRSILIMPVSGEEKGLLGSSFYSDNPVYPLENTVANLNIDMIGRIDDRHDDGNYVYLIGSDKLSSELHLISENANDMYIGTELDYTYNDPKDPNRYYYRSDHYNFAKHGIPVIFYFNGTHDDYHKASDTIEKIDFDKMERITRLVFYTAWDIANRDKRPVVDKENDFE